MFGEDTGTPSLRYDHRTPASSTAYFIEGYEAYDHQTFAASDSLCSMSRRCESSSLQPEIKNKQNDFGLHKSHIPRPPVPYQYTAWKDKDAYPLSPAKVYSDLWESVPHEHVVNHYPSISEAGQGYNSRTMPYFPTNDVLPVLSPIQHRTTPSETSMSPFSGLSTPLSSINTSSYSFNSTPASSVEPEHEEMEDLIPAIGHMKKPTTGISGAPYAKLIELALLGAEGNRLYLKDLYTWFEINTDKATNPETSGWKNSVRHNLSMNGAFTKVEASMSPSTSRKSYMWMLKPSAKEHGIESTTRFRRKNEIRRGIRKPTKSDGRARSGRKGGWASQKSAKLRNDSQAAAMWPSSEALQHCNPSDSGYSSFEPPETAPPVFPAADYYQPYFTSQPMQHFATQTTEGYNYSEPSSYNPPESRPQLAAYHDDANPQVWPSSQVWPAPPSTMMNHAPGGYGAS